MHVYMTCYAVVTRHVGTCRRFFLHLFKKIYLLETKVSNKLLWVRGVMSSRTKSPFIFLTFLFFTPHVLNFKHVFRLRSFQGRISSLFLGEFRDNLRFLKLVCMFT